MVVAPPAWEVAVVPSGLSMGRHSRVIDCAPLQPHPPALHCCSKAPNPRDCDIWMRSVRSPLGIPHQQRSSSARSSRPLGSLRSVDHQISTWKPLDRSEIDQLTPHVMFRCSNLGNDKGNSSTFGTKSRALIAPWSPRRPRFKGSPYRHVNQ